MPELRRDIGCAERRISAQHLFEHAFTFRSNDRWPLTAEITMKRGFKALLLAIASCLSVGTLGEFLYGDGIWPEFALTFFGGFFFAALALCLAGSIGSIVILFHERLRLRVGLTFPCSILILSSLLAGLRSFQAVTYRQAQNRTVKIEIEGPDDYCIDGIHATRGQAEQTLRVRQRKYGGGMPIHFRACPSTVFSQVESILSPFWQINIGLVGDSELLPAKLSPMPDDILGPPVNVVRIYASPTNFAGIHFDFDGHRLDPQPVMLSSFAQEFLRPPTNGLDYRVILYCSSNTPFSAIWNVVQQGGSNGLGIVYFQNDSDIRHIKGKETDINQSRSNTASDATLKHAPAELQSPLSGCSSASKTNMLTRQECP